MQSSLERTTERARRGTLAVRHGADQGEGERQADSDNRANRGSKSINYDTYMDRVHTDLHLITYCIVLTT